MFPASKIWNDRVESLAIHYREVDQFLYSEQEFTALKSDRCREAYLDTHYQLICFLSGSSHDTWENVDVRIVSVIGAGKRKIELSAFFPQTTKKIKELYFQHLLNLRESER
jgi:hypothetical protein